MNWKQILLTSGITLIVTILSGVIVNWYVKTNLEEKKKNEEIVYEIKRISNFESDSLKISLFTVDIQNIGNEKANNVEVIIEFEKDVKILGTAGMFERTNKDFRPLKLLDNKISYTADCLFPKDRFTINVALNNLISSPSILVQSSESIGKPFVRINANEKVSSFEKDFVIIIIATLMLIPVLLILTRLLKKYSGYPANINDNAFLFIHNNQCNIATDLLLSEIKTKGGSSLELSNLALAKCLNKESKEEYETLLRMSEFITYSKRDKLILTFNRFLIACYSQDYLKAKENLELAGKLEKRELAKYLNYSLIVADFIKNDKNVSEIVENYKKHFA